MKSIKRFALIIILTLLTGFGFYYSAHAESLESVMQQFKAAQAKLRELRQSGASASEISAQESKIRILRSKADDLQASQGQ